MGEQTKRERKKRFFRVKQVWAKTIAVVSFLNSLLLDTRRFCARPSTQSPLPQGKFAIQVCAHLFLA